MDLATRIKERSETDSLQQQIRELQEQVAKLSKTQNTALVEETALKGTVLKGTIWDNAELLKEIMTAKASFTSLKEKYGLNEQECWACLDRKYYEKWSISIKRTLGEPVTEVTWPEKLEELNLEELYNYIFTHGFPQAEAHAREYVKPAKLSRTAFGQFLEEKIGKRKPPNETWKTFVPKNDTLALKAESDFEKMIFEGKAFSAVSKALNMNASDKLAIQRKYRHRFGELWVTTLLRYKGEEIQREKVPTPFQKYQNPEGVAKLAKMICNYSYKVVEDKMKQKCKELEEEYPSYYLGRFLEEQTNLLIADFQDRKEFLERIQNV